MRNPLPGDTSEGSPEGEDRMIEDKIRRKKWKEEKEMQLERERGGRRRGQL